MSDEFTVEPKGTFGYKISRVGKGALPKYLEGEYTSVQEGEKAIMLYLFDRDKPKRSYHKSRNLTNGQSTDS